MFKLLIECSKDFEELSIKFADGKVVTTTTSKPPVPKSIKKESKKTDYLDLSDIDADQVSSQIVKKPVIDVIERPVKVAEELQNLDI